MSELHLGDIVNYVLLSKDRPTDPNRLWRGQVRRIMREYIMVESLEPGYEGQTEYIEAFQVKSVEVSHNPWGRITDHIMQGGDRNTYKRGLK